ncbi:hypothetical protein EOD41_13730 [Mucilaginibacter limnophilus]|uniref:Uncharacterized protein n=1 Tax=Mucilaginibacter limnophilus TaxID=1932778 RepID=A0A437MQT9_9SPHI|nr:hypothetical protein [Mucilaginibacter limnophilus]RVU00021.1 hypothetical protein EOD41_13730 [Mucilaginibacter limnophilus]
MENKDWLNEFPELKKVNANNPFTVPDGYFHNLSERILSLNKLNALTVNNGGFNVPENYFDELSGNIMSRINIGEAINVENTGFTVPEGYFNELTGNVQSRITIEEAVQQETAGFEVPQGYFEDLQQQITARIAVEKALNVEPQETFAVPAGYFDKLNAAILDKTVNADKNAAAVEKVKRQTIVRRLFNSRIYKYAVAACITVVIGVSFLIGSNNNPPQHTATYLHTQLSDIPVSEIKNYVEQNLDAGETQVMLTDPNVSDEEILDYIDTEL